jgi:acyl-CoA synthetase (AMP-forming)/AMP-acid ligase II
MAQVSRRDSSIVHGPAQPVAIEKTFGTLLREQAKLTPSALLVASEHQNKTLSYLEADRRSDDLAKGLSRLGVKRGDRVAIMAGNEIEYVEVFFASAKLGAMITLANYGYTEDELASVLTSCGASILVMVPAFDRYDYTKWIPNLKTNIPCLNHVVMMHGDDRFAGHVVGYEDVIAAGSHNDFDLLAVEKTISARDIVNLQFTSGSTGAPKASALTHRGIYNAGRFIGDTMYLKRTDRICLPVPLFHSFGLIIGLATVSAHGAAIILPDNKFNIEATLACIPKYGCTGLYGVTTMFVAEMAHPNFSSYDLSTLRFAILAGSAVPETLMRKVWEGFGITQTHTNWGLTESSSICTMTKDTDTIPQRTITSGSMFPGFSAKVVDPTSGEAVPRGDRGEIVLRGYGMQNCYFANDKKTAEAHYVSVEDGLEWFKTGDEGYLDPEGYFVITGRIKDMIIRGGENIAPLEIEERLASHPSIAQSAVIGVPDEKYGEQICAFLEPSGKAAMATDEELRSWVTEKLAGFKKPKYLIWLGSHPEFTAWPKTASGKLRKPDLRIIASKILAQEPQQVRAQL